MKVGLALSVLLHAAALSLAPSAAPAHEESPAASCRCDYEMTVTDARPPRALTLGEVPAHRFDH